MKLRWIFLFSIISTLAIADDIQSIAGPEKFTPNEVIPPPLPCLPEDGDDIVLIPNAQGLILTGSTECVENRHIEGVEILGLEIPGCESQLIARLTPLFYHQDLTQRRINQIKREIVLFYREQHHPVMMVYIPEQQIRCKVLQIVVIEATVCNIDIVCNRFSNTERIRNLIRLESGQTIDEHRLLQDITWINMNPYRSANILYSPGPYSGTTNVTIKVSDRKPWRIYAGGDNTGSQYTGEARWFAGINFENAFFPENLISFQFTTSSDFHKFKSATMQYIIPFPWRNTLSIFGGYAVVRPHLTDFRSKGKSYQIGARYDIPIWRTYPIYPQQIVLGFDFKGTNNNLVFGTDNLLVQSSLVNIAQFVFGYHFNMERWKQKIATGVDVFWSPCEMVPHQSNSNFQTLNPHAHARYAYARLFYSHDAMLPKQWSLFGQIRTQFSDSSLIASEQFGLGGFNTVRGYRERSVNGDNGVCTNFEVRTPPLRAISAYTCRFPRDSIYFLAFFDFGYAWDKNRIPGFPLTQTLIGIGPGFRYRIGSYLNMRFDLGFPLHDIQATSERVRAHLSAVVSF